MDIEPTPSTVKEEMPAPYKHRYLRARIRILTAAIICVVALIILLLFWCPCSAGVKAWLITACPAVLRSFTK